MAPSARPAPGRHRIPTSASAATTPDRCPVRVRADGAGRQGRVGVSTLSPRIRPARALAWRAPAGRLRPPRPPIYRPEHDSPEIGERMRYGWGQRRAVPSGPPDLHRWWRSSGAAGESRSGRTGRPSCSCATGPYGPAARSPMPTSSRLRGAIRGRSLAGRLRKAGRAMVVRTPPSRMVNGQTAAAVSAGSTSVQDEPSSADRVTASSTSWTCNASANEGAGSTSVATASMKSRIWCVNECS